MVPHFSGEANPSISIVDNNTDNICRSVPYQGSLVDRLSNSPLSQHNNLREDNCLKVKSSTFGPVFLFVIAQILLGSGGRYAFLLILFCVYVVYILFINILYILFFFVVHFLH